MIKTKMLCVTAVLTLGLLSPPAHGAAAGGSERLPAAVVPPGGGEGVPRPIVTIPQESPDRQRFRPETPGEKIRQNREQVEQYKAVPPPGEPKAEEEGAKTK